MGAVSLFTPPVNGACAGRTDVDWDANTHKAAAAAKDICDGCPIRQACLDYALTTRQEGGVWGGLLEQERLRLLNPKTRTAGGARKAEVERRAREVARMVTDGVPDAGIAEALGFSMSALYRYKRLARDRNLIP